MAKKPSSQSSRKISNNKSDKKYLNSLIKVLKPKVYITDSSNFKTLVQELTGNNNGRNPIPLFPPSPTPIQEPVFEIPIFEIEENESSSTSVDSSEASMPLMAAAAADSPQQDQEVYVSETFNVLENIQKIERIPNYCDIESWLLQIEDSSCSYNSPDVIIPPTFQQEVSFFNDLSSLIV